AIGRSHTAGGTCYVTAVIAEPGVIRHTVMDSLIFGELDGSRSTRLQRLLDACAGTGFKATVSDRIDVDIWSKFVRLSVFSGMTAVTRCSIGPIAADAEVFGMLKAALREAHAVARAKGVEVPDSIIADVEKAYSTMAPEAKSSMLQDLERGRRLELPWLSGAIVRLGQEVGVDTPTHRFIATALKPHVDGRSRNQSPVAGRQSPVQR
ncbi:MAG TPA: ketopantoate reductase C-terminal domain-containing protein, partial [Vicinamibacterales bacterium]|nr:ketopantoate reductase C-terminal domain-containing protein [Vicinamibacterales bacterium]